MIHIKGLSFQYSNSEHQALNDITLDIGKGEFVGIIGPGGAGKSTLMYCINGVVPHYFKGDYYGRVSVMGNDPMETELSRLSVSVGSVFQDPEMQIVSSTVKDEILFGLENFNIPSGEMEERLCESLEMTGITHLKDRAVSSLSGGQKQRCVIAAAIALRPQILLLDEPTSELDPMGSINIFETLKTLHRRYRMTIVIIEQKVRLLSEYCKRLLVMKDGKIVIDGDNKDVLRRTKQLKEIGVNCPHVVSLADRLTDDGLYSGTYPLHTEEAKDMVKSVLGKKQGGQSHD